MRRRTFGLVIPAITINLLGDCNTVEQQQFGTLQVVAVDSVGGYLESFGLTVLQEGKEVASSSRGSAFQAKLAYGNYRLKISPPGFRSATQDIEIAQQETFVRVPVEVGGTGCPSAPGALGGSIRNAPPGSDLWVKAVPVRGIGGLETKVTSRGFFLIEGLRSRDYILMVVDGDRLLFHQLVNTRASDGKATRLDIDLARKLTPLP